MTLLSDFVAALRRSRRRHDTLLDLRRLSAGQLADVGIEKDRLEEAVDGMLAAGADRRLAERGSYPPFSSLLRTQG